MSLVHLDLRNHAETRILRENFTFKGLKLGKNSLKFVFENIESSEREDVVLDYGEPLFDNVNAHLQVISCLMLNFEEIAKDNDLMSLGFKFDYLDADVELSDVEEQMRSINNDSALTPVYRTEKIIEAINLSTLRENRIISKLMSRLLIHSINVSSNTLRIKGRKHRNNASIDEGSFFSASDKGTDITYLPVGIGEEYINEEGELMTPYSYRGEFFPFWLELHEQFHSIESHAFIFLEREIKRLSSVIKLMSPVDSLDEINGEIGGSASDPEPQPAKLF